MHKPFGIEYLEPMSTDDSSLSAVHGSATCILVDTFHTKSNTHTVDEVCND